MKVHKNGYRRFARLGWLIAAIVTLGYAAHAAPVAESYAVHRQSVKVERIHSTDKHHSATVFDLTKMLASPDAGSAVTIRSFPENHAISLFHGYLAKVALTACSVRVSSIEYFIPFLSDRSVGFLFGRESPCPANG